MGGVQGGAIVNFATAGGTGGVAFTLNGTTDSVSLVAGPNITLNSGASSITIIGAAGAAAGTNTFSASGTSIAGTALSIAMVAGANVSLQTATGVGSMTVSVSGLNALSASTYASSTGTMTLTAGAGITLTTGASIISIIGNTTAVATNFSLNASSSSVSLIPGAGISFASNLSTITISNSSPNLFSTISLSASGNTTGATSSGTANNVLAYSGMGIVSIGAGNGTISISATTPSVTNYSTVSLSASGNTTSSSSGTMNNVLAFSGMGIASVGVGNGSVSISVPAPAASGILYVSASSAAGGATLGTVTSAPINSTLSLFAGTGITLSQGSNDAITIIGNTTAGTPDVVSAFGIDSITAGGGTSGTTTLQRGTVLLAAGSNITLSSSGGEITIIGPNPGAGAAGTNTISASGTSIVGTALSLAIAAGANISLQTATAAGAMTISVSGENAVSMVGIASSTGTLSLSQNAGITFITNGANAQIGIGTTGFSKLSLTQNYPLCDIGGSIASASGTVTGTAGFGSSLFLGRIDIPVAMTLSEIDLAMAMSFNATSNGAGTLSQSMVLYSFGNSSSLATVGSASATYAWQTGTSTSGAVVSLTQFQGGWSVPKLHPMTFATTAVTPGEYVVGNLINFAQASSTWTINLLGALNSITNSTTLSNVTTTGQTLASALTQSVGMSFTTGYQSIAQVAVTNVEATKTNASSAGSLYTAGILASSRTFLSASTTSSYFFTGATSIGTGTAISSLSLSTQSIVPQYLTVPNLVYIGTGSTTSALPSVFIAGIMSTGAVPVAITLTSTAVTYFGTAAGAQPYFALIGS